MFIRTSHGAGTTEAPIMGCPPSTSISPCTCKEVMMNGGVIYVSCYNQNLTNSQLSNILDVFLSPHYISPVYAIMASQNQLTYAPSQIAKFKSLTRFDLSFNQITNISPLSGLSFPSNSSISIMLNNNKITSIPSGIFNCASLTSCFIELSSNNITFLPANAFIFPPTHSLMMFSYLSLQNNQITTISAGAFQGMLSLYLQLLLCISRYVIIIFAIIIII